MPNKTIVVPVDMWGDSWWTAGELWRSPQTPSAVCPPAPNIQLEGEQSITYENSNRSCPNPCHHTVTWRASKAFMENGFTAGGIIDWDYRWKTTNPWIVELVGNDTYRHIMPNSPWSVPRSQLLETDPYVVDSAIAEALGSLRLGCRQQVFALPRAVLELRDLPRTIKNIAKLDKWVGDLFDGGILLKNLPKAIQGRSRGYKAAWIAGQTVSELCNQYLGIVFGIKPTKSDVNTFLGRPTDLRRPLKLAATQPKLYKGQKLEVPFKVGPPSSAFPTLSGYSLNYDIPLQRDYHSSNGITEHLAGMRGNAYTSNTHSGVIFGEVVGLPARMDMVYGEQLAMSGGGPLATAWELIPYSWLSDSVYNIGKLIAQAERRALPLELRPALRFGPWLSHKTCESTFLPRYRVSQHSVSLHTLPDPSNGYGGLVKVYGSVIPIGYEVAFEGNVKYDRHEIVGRFDDVSMPVQRYPGGYVLGPTAALFTQSVLRKQLK